METRTMEIEGMSCGHCVARVEKALAALPGVTVEQVTVGSARVAIDPRQTSLEQIAQAIDDAGYTLRECASA
jgi:copper chaperone